MFGLVQEVADADSPSVWRRYHSPLARSVWEPRDNNSGTIMVSAPLKSTMKRPKMNILEGANC